MKRKGNREKFVEIMHERKRDKKRNKIRRRTLFWWFAVLKISSTSWKQTIYIWPPFQCNAAITVLERTRCFFILNIVMVQANPINIDVYFWYLVKVICPVYATVHVYIGQVTFLYRVPERHGHV